MNIKALTLFLFCFCMAVGLHLAAHNPLENDEIYSQQNSIQGHGYINILAGKIVEGNNPPLFYLAQKLFLGVAGFRLPTITNPEENFCNPNAQILVRFLPVVFMSAAICVLFYYFAAAWGLWFGILAVLLAFVSPMTWLYWAQARPYGLWMLLSIIQIIMFMKVLQNPDDAKGRGQLFIVHLLLCFASSFGMLQAAAAAVFLRRDFTRLGIIPVAIGIFYFLHTPHFVFRVPHPWLMLITHNLPPERAVLMAACSLWLLLNNHRPQFPSEILLLAYTFALLVVPLGIVGYYLHLNVQGVEGFELSNRYFMFLTPLGIMAAMLLWLRVWQATTDRWVRIYLMEGMAGILLLGAIETYVLVQRLVI